MRAAPGEPLSARNPRIRRLRLLARDPASRRHEGAYVIEGFTLVADALAAGVQFEALFVEPAAAGHPVVAAVADVGASVLSVAEGALRGVVDAASPQPVAAIVAKPVGAGIDKAGGGFVVMLVGIADPGNAGTMMRSAEAAGADALVLTSGSVDAFNPKCVRASAGAIFRLPLVTSVTPADALGVLGESGYRRIGTTVSGGVAYDELDLTTPLVLVLGNEATGLDIDRQSGLGAQLDQLATVPMDSQVESLNVAMAATVLCFEVRRQRRAVARRGTDLPSFGVDGIVRRP